MENEFISVKECAKLFGVSTSTIYKAIKKGHIPFIRIGDAKKSPFRISRKYLDALHVNMTWKIRRG